MRIDPRDALLIADPQNDFMPDGALGVAEGDRILGPLNRVMRLFDLILASQDWHPENHISFEERGGPWPPHCVQRTRGAEFHPGLDQSRLQLIIRKGFDPDREQYSCFHGSPLADMLRGWDLHRLYVTGITTEYCVHDSAIDAVEAGFQVTVLTDCIAAVNVHPDDGNKALADMARVATLVSSAELG